MKNTLTKCALNYIELYEQRAARRQSLPPYRKKYSVPEVIKIMHDVGDDKRWAREDQHKAVVHMRAMMLKRARKEFPLVPKPQKKRGFLSALFSML